MEIFDGDLAQLLLQVKFSLSNLECSELAADEEILNHDMHIKERKADSQNLRIETTDSGIGIMSKS